MVDVTQQTQQMMQVLADKLPSIHQGGFCHFASIAQIS